MREEEGKEKPYEVREWLCAQVEGQESQSRGGGWKDLGELKGLERAKLA